MICRVMIRLLCCSFTGTAIADDDRSCFFTNMTNAIAGDAAAQMLAGYHYAEGKGVAQNSKISFEWYTKSASNGNAIAQFTMGELFYSGSGVLQDYKEAAKLSESIKTSYAADYQEAIDEANELIKKANAEDPEDKDEIIESQNEKIEYYERKKTDSNKVYDALIVILNSENPQDISKTLFENVRVTK